MHWSSIPKPSVRPLQILAALSTMACADSGPRPNFSLPDVAPVSPRAGEIVSPSDYEGEVSGWYFGHSS